MPLQEVAALLLKCRARPERMTLLTEATLPKGDVDAIRTRLLHEVPLPDGMFHDGSSFIDEDGERSAEHPELAAALKVLLDERNASAAAHNAQVNERNGVNDRNEMNDT